MEPCFYHAVETEIPSWQVGELHYKLIAGEALGHQSPVPVFSPMYLLEIKSLTTQVVDLKGKLYGESALYILQGSIESDGHTFGPKQILIAADSELCSFTIGKDSIIYIFGGQAFPEERFIYWNFVSSDRELIEQAKERWREQLFDKVPGENSFIPLPVPLVKKNA